MKEDKLTETEFLKKYSYLAVYGYLEDYKVLKTKIVDEWRHGTNKKIIIQNIKTGKKFWGCYRDSCKETMEFCNMNYGGINFEELKEESQEGISVGKEFIVFSDLHLHKFPYANTTKTGENELLISGLDILDQVYAYAKKNGIKHIIFLGDLFHIRLKVDSEVYCSLVWEKFCDLCREEDAPELIIVPGNHDQISKTGKHKLLPFASIPKISVINDFYKKDNLIFCPHQYNIEDLYTFLEANSDENSIVFLHQLLINSPLMNNAIFRKNEAVDISRFKYNTIFSGHNHRPFTNAELKVYNLGSPMHYDYGDAQCQERYFIDYRGHVKWIRTEFPHFALHGTTEAKKASYIKKQSKKVQELSNRTEINFNDDASNILKVYTESEATLLPKDLLLKDGLRLLNNAIQTL